MKCFLRPAVLLVCLCSTAGIAYAASTERVSVTSTGAQATNDTTGVAFGSFSSVSSISDDGRFVAFASYATNLVTPDANGGDNPDVFVHDRLLGTTKRVNVSTGGTQASTPSSYPTISGNGRFVAFTSFATNLVPGDSPFPNNFSDIFLRDTLNNTTERVSVSSAEALGDNDSLHLPSISADGRYVAFPSYATNLVGSDNNGKIDVFVRDRTTGTTERVSVNSAEVQANGDSNAAVISPNGRFVAFSSEATNLVAPATVSGIAHVFVRDRVAGTTELISLNSSEGRANNDNVVTDISADGRFVAFSSAATNLVANDANGKIDVFVRDRTAGTTERVSLSSAEIQGNQDSANAALSANGRYVSFSSYATNLVTGDTNNYLDFFVRDRLSGTTERVNVSSAGAQANHPGTLVIPPEAAISADGRFVAFTSDADNLVPSDTNELDDIFVRDRGSPPNDLLGDFGTAGIHQFLNNAAWLKVHAGNPAAIAVGDLDGNFKDEEIAGFSNGVFVRYNNAGTFVRKTTAAAVHVAAGDLDGDGRDEVMADRGATGLWVSRNNGTTWTQLRPWAGQGFAVGDLDNNRKEDLAVDFGTRGLWVLLNNATWVQPYTGNSTYIAVGDLDGNGRDELIADRGAGAAGGIFVRYNNAGAWMKKHASTSQGLAIGDLDGNGREELLVDRGATGLFALFNNATWVRLHTVSPTFFTTADLDSSGKADVVAGLGASGLFVRYNNAGGWVRISTSVTQGLAAGGFD